MVAGIRLNRTRVARVLKQLGHTNTRKKFRGADGTKAAVWVTHWGYHFLVPEDEEGFCPHWVLAELIDAVSKTEPRAKKE